MDLALEWLPAQGDVEQLIVLLHGAGADGHSLAPLARALRAEFPQSAVLAPNAPLPGEGGSGHQWFPAAGITEDNRPERVAAAVAALGPWLAAQQQRLHAGRAATALGGFSQGAIVALEAVLADDGVAGRVLAFGGRFARLPQAAPRLSTLHLFHGGADAVIPAQHARAALEAMQVLRGDATVDIAEGVGHVLHPVLVERAIWRLRHHIPARTWRAALGADPAAGTRPEYDEED